MASKYWVSFSRSLLLAAVLAGCAPRAELGPGDIQGPPVRLELVSGGGQTGEVGTGLPLPLLVRVTDSAGRPAAGVTVAFAVDDQVGTFVPNAPQTDDQGEAEARWTLGHLAGTATASVSVAGVEPLLVSATATPGPVNPARSTLSVDFPSIVIGDTTPVRITVRDSFDNPLVGTAIQLSVDGPEGVLVQPAVSDSQGKTSGVFRATTAGTDVVKAQAGGVPLAQAATVTVSPQTVATVTVTPSDTSALVGQSVQLVAVVRDDQGREIPGAAVDWSSGDTTVANVDAQGTVTARSPGLSTISATAGGRTGSGRVSVSYGEGTFKGLTYCTINGVSDLMDVYVPSASVARPLPVAVHVHGGGWVGGHRSTGWEFDTITQKLLQRGYLVASLDYRLAPTHKYPSQIQDVKCAIRHLRANASRYGLDPDRIGAWGGSAGGQLVALLGTTDASSGFDGVGGFQGVSSSVRAVIAMSAITDFTHPDELRDDYSNEFLTWPQPDSPEMIDASPVTHVTSDDPPFYFIVGAEDTLVLPAQSARMDSLLRVAGVESSLLSVLHAGHALAPTSAVPIDPDPATIITRMADFFDRHLR